MLRRLLSEVVKPTLADGWNPSDVISNPSGYFLFKFNLRIKLILPGFKVFDFSNKPIAEVNFSKESSKNKICQQETFERLLFFWVCFICK